MADRSAKKMGFGGFHIHACNGLSTKYLGKEFMDLVKACTEKSEAEQSHIMEYRFTVET